VNGDETSRQAGPGREVASDYGRDAALTEYTALRDEILQAMRSQQSVLGFGTAALALLVGAGLDVAERQASAVIFLVLLPFVAQLVLLVWGTEIFRLLRASDYLAHFEDRMADRLGERVLRWEWWIRGAFDEGHAWPDLERHQSVAIRLMFNLISVGSLALGTFSAFRRLDFGLASFLVAFGLGVFAVSVWQVQKAFRRADDAREQMREHAGRRVDRTA
jgi:hypothetical protein